MQEIDTSNGVMFPFYDPDTNMVYLCGKVCHVCLSFCLSACMFTKMLSSVWDATDISHAVRLSSVWSINFQHHSPSAATGYSCVAYVKMAARFTVAQCFKHLKKQKVLFKSL